MFLPTKSFTEDIEGHKGEPTFRVGRKVPHEAVNLAFYYNPTATDAERVLCADAPRNTIDHRIEVKYLYKYGCPDNDNSKFKYFDPYYYYEDEEGYTGYLPLIEVTWYEHKHVLTKYIQQTKTFITDKKNNVENCIYYAENSDGGVVSDPDPAKIDPKGVYCGYLFLNSATWEVKSVNTEIIKQSKEMPVRSYELEPQQVIGGYFENVVKDANLNELMLAPNLNSLSPWPDKLYVLSDGIYDNPNGYGVAIVDENPFDGYVTNPANPLRFKMLEKEPLSWSEYGYVGEMDTGGPETSEYGAIFLSEFEKPSNCLIDPSKTSYSGEEELNDFIELAKQRSINKGNTHKVTGDPTKDEKLEYEDSGTNAWTILTEWQDGTGKYKTEDIVVQLYQFDEDESDETNKKLRMAAYKVIVKNEISSGTGGKGGIWAVYCNYEGTLYQITEEIKQTPATWEATCIYEGQVDKKWNTYDGMAMYKGAVTQGEGAGNVNPELSPDILLYPDDEGYLRRILTSAENDDKGNIVEVTKNLYEIEAEHFYITDVFKDGTACFYKHDLKYPIHDYRGPDRNGNYGGDAVSVYTSTMRDLPEGYVYQLKLKATSKETEKYILDREVREREVALRYSASLYTNFISKTTSTYKACYHAFTKETDRTDEEIYNYPFMFKNVDYIVESVDKYERSSKIKMLEPNIIDDTRAWVNFEYVIKAIQKKSGNIVFTTQKRSARILNKEYAVESEHVRFEGRAMIISPKINGNWQSPLDLVLDDEKDFPSAPVLASNFEDYMFSCEVIADDLPDAFRGAINVKCNADGSGCITAETTLDTGFLNPETGLNTDKLIINNPYLVENGRIYAGYMVKCLDVRHIAVRPPRERNLLDSWYPLLRFGHYSQVQDQYGAHTKICYTMPEYDDQDCSSIYGIPYIDIKKDRAEILNPHMIKVDKYPLLIFDAAGNIANSFTFGRKVYRVFLNVMTWKSAQKYCESIGGNLAMPKTQEELERIISIAKEFNINGLWLGGTDEGHEGTWTWVDGTPVEYSNWNTGEPNNMGGNEHYMETYTSGNEAGKWNDLADNNTGGISGFICEIDKYATISVYRDKGDDGLYKLTVDNVSFSEGIIMVEEAVSENDTILVDYTYLEEYYQYRGFYRNRTDFARIDLNPNMYHTYSDMTYEPSELKPTLNLFNKTLYFYLRPTIRIKGEDVEDKQTIIDSSDSDMLSRLYDASDILKFTSSGIPEHITGADKGSEWANVDGTIRSLKNSEYCTMFLTDRKYSNYTHEVTMSSSDYDDDVLLTVISAVEDGAGGVHTLSVLCAPNRSQGSYLNLPSNTVQFAIIFDYCQGDRMKVLAEDSSFTTTGGWASYPGGMNIRIDKTADDISIFRSELLTAESDAIGSSPAIFMTLEQVKTETGVDFAEGAVGYGNYSQIGATFSSIKLEVSSETSSSHIEWDVDHPLAKNDETLYHTIDEYMPESELDIYIGSVYIRQNTSLYSTILIDTRTRGGGVIESMRDSLRKQLEPESDWYLDIGCYDGLPYQENAVIVIRLDNRILKEYGGRFSQGDVEIKVKKFLGLGVYPIIEYVDSYTKYELPQYNLEIKDTYSNILDVIPDFTVECIEI